MSQSARRLRIYAPVRVGQKVRFSGKKPENDMSQKEFANLMVSVAMELGLDSVEGKTFEVKGFKWSEEHDEFLPVADKCVVYQVVTLREKTEQKPSFEVSVEFLDVPYLEFESEDVAAFSDIAHAMATDPNCLDSFQRAAVLCLARGNVRKLTTKV